MTPQEITARFQTLALTILPAPGAGATAVRHRAIFDAGREDLSLAKLIEAHWDAVAILTEAGLEPADGATYAVWASEIPGQPLVLLGPTLNGRKHFCSGAPLVDRALVTAGTSLVEVNMRATLNHVTIDESGWNTEAFGMTRTATLTFENCPTVRVVGVENWYTKRRGFWQGACGPAAAWAGGAAGLFDYALTSKRADAHSTAHLGAMFANVQAMKRLLAAVGDTVDGDPHCDATIEALSLRHTIEQLSTDVIRRFARSLGPAPLIQDASVARRYAELDLFMRQSHAERDLESLGREIRK